MAVTSLPPPPSAWTLLTEWSLHPTALAVILAGATYEWGIRRLRRAGSTWPRARRVAFLAGSSILLVALASPIDTYAEVTFSAHAVQHLLLTLIAPPLLAMGAPVTLALRVASARRARQLGRVLTSRVVGAAAHPVTGWGLFAVVPFAVHFSPLYQAALTNGWVHALEHVLLFGVGALYWWPVVAADPVGRRMHDGARVLSLMLAMPAQSFLALAIFSSTRPLYDAYASLPASFGPGALADQRLAASIMWVFGGLVLVLAALLVAARWSRAERAQRRRAERSTVIR